MSALISSTAAAPSETCELLPAVILPSSLKAGLSLLSASMLESGRIPWSVWKVSPLTWKGTISRSKRPSSVARAASWWERTPISSSSERGISHLSAIISAEIPWGTRLKRSASGPENAMPCSCMTEKPSAKEMCPMCSTPPPIATSWTPEAISAAAKLMPCWAEPHWRSTVVAGTSIGSPASSQALRPMFMPCSPNCWTQPQTTSPTSFGSIPARSISEP